MLNKSRNISSRSDKRRVSWTLLQNSISLKVHFKILLIFAPQVCIISPNALKIYVTFWLVRHSWDSQTNTSSTKVVAIKGPGLRSCPLYFAKPRTTRFWCSFNINLLLSDLTNILRNWNFSEIQPISSTSDLKAFLARNCFLSFLLNGSLSGYLIVGLKLSCEMTNVKINFLLHNWLHAQLHSI